MLKIKTIITTDGEVDDMNSLIHLCPYLNEIDLLGVVYTSSQYHFLGDGIHTLGEVTPNYRTSGPVGLERPRTVYGPDPNGKDLKSFRPFPKGWIEDIWNNEYKDAYPCLIKNAKGFPTPEHLCSITKVGNVEFEGDVRFDTEGSDLIKKYLLEDNDNLIYLQSWGGVNTIVRALLSIYNDYKDSDKLNDVVSKVVAKTRILGVNKGVGQDNSWLDNKIPELYPGIVTLWPENLYGTYMLFGPGQPDIRDTFKAPWLTKYIHNGKSKLMNSYHLMGDGVKIEGEADVYQFGLTATLDFGFPNVPAVKYDQYDFIGEGDSNTYVPLFGFGLRGNEDPKYPGLLGRCFKNDEKPEAPYNPQTGKFESFNPFVSAYQEDWAARARWCYQEYETANHAPIVEVEKQEFYAKPLEEVELNVKVSDPDGDSLNLSWEIYPQYNNYNGSAKNLSVWEPYNASTHFTVPEDAKEGDYFVLTLRAKDNDETTPMTTFGTIVVHVK